MEVDYIKALLALEDGTIFKGRSFTGDGEAVGEVVFNTSMSGYQEILTDPSYCGQMVTMTYPLIGNYGINDQDVESERIQVKAFLVKEYQECPATGGPGSLWPNTSGKRMSRDRGHRHAGPHQTHPGGRGHEGRSLDH
jgi:hypothetical protein